MTEAEAPSPQGAKASRNDRILLLLELLVFALPCYLIYMACAPWAIIAVSIIPSAIGEVISSKGAASVLDDISGILPFLILGVTACLGVRPLWRSARLIFRVLAGSPVGAAEAAMLTKTLRLAALPLTVMILSGIGSAIPSLSKGSSWAIRTWPDAIFGLYLSGVPLLVPALHLRRIFIRGS